MGTIVAMLRPMAMKRDIEKTYPRREFVAKLRRLADAIETNAPFTIQVAGERLRIPSSARFNIEHERIRGEHELEFQLRWKDEE
jgi:amphi-Trp domain-containing protein